MIWQNLACQIISEPDPIPVSSEIIESESIFEVKKDGKYYKNMAYSLEPSVYPISESYKKFTVFARDSVTPDIFIDATGSHSDVSVLIYKKSDEEKVFDGDNPVRGRGQYLIFDKWFSPRDTLRITNFTLLPDTEYIFRISDMGIIEFPPVEPLSGIIPLSLGISTYKGLFTSVEITGPEYMEEPVFELKFLDDEPGYNSILSVVPQCRILKVDSILYDNVGPPHYSYFQDFEETDYFTDTAFIQPLVSVQYLDGLGRTIQTVQKGITPLGNDLVSIKEYDGFGRDSLIWLPGYGIGNGAFTHFDEVKTSAKRLSVDSKPYSMPVYEASPLNRVLEQYGPGNDWHTKRKALRNGYLTNKSKSGNIGNVGDSLVCARFIVDDNKTNLTVIMDGNYSTGELFVTRKLDEDNNTSYEFKDKLGQVLLTRQINDGQLHDTYYVYDSYGNLKMVFPPMAADRIYSNKNELGGGSYVRMNLAYLYQYDERNRCIGKKLPGCEWVRYIYDDADQLIFSQDSEQSKDNNWSFNKYDKLGRVILSGVQVITKNHDLLRTQYKNTVIREEAVLINSGSAYSYTWNTMPDVTSSGVLTANYYDNYDFLLREGFENLTYDQKTGFGTRFGNDNNKVAAKGMLTGTVVGLLDGSGQFLYSAMYYDERGRLIQTKSTNHLGGIDKEYVAYNFTGQPVKKLTEQSIQVERTTYEQNPIGDGGLIIGTRPIVTTEIQTITELYQYEYDHAGRLVKTTHQLDDKNPVVLAENEYDELGRLKSTQATKNTSLKTGYEYNIRSWIKWIYSSTIDSDDSAEDYYSQFLQYKHNGNISSSYYNNYQGMGDHYEYEYRYTYDGLSRLTNAVYHDGEGEFTDLCSTSYNYDKHGNISWLKRNGKTTSSGYGMIDQLDINYTGNQLKKVTDTARDVLLSESADFKDYANQDIEYTFNTNGAMTGDLNKGVRISYNMLNLPQSISVSNRLVNGGINYTYSATGQKLKVKYSYDNRPVINPIEGLEELPSIKEKDLLPIPIEENPIQITKPDIYKHYIGNKVYKEGSERIQVGEHTNIVLDKILVDNGYIENGIYYFYIKDHLGNNRMVVNESGQLIQQTDYYPFGMPFTGGHGAEKQQYKYGSKEFDTMHGLNQYDFHARQYDPAIGRFTTVDPLSEKYYSISPYVYCANNPMRLIDPTGKTFGDFMLGFVQAVGENIAMGAVEGNGNIASDGNHYDRGRALGNVTSLGMAAHEIAGGAGLIAGGGITTAVSGGGATPVSVPAIAAGTTAIAHGVGMATNAIKNIVSEMSGSGGSSGGSSSSTTATGRGVNHLKPNSKATGEHSTFRRNKNGEISHYTTYKKNSKNPSGFDEVKRFDGKGSAPHKNKKGEPIEAPHVHEKGQKDPRPARPDEIPKSK